MPLSNLLRRRILVLAAHPDDETAGAGGLLAARAAAGMAAVLILTEGVPANPAHFAAGSWTPQTYAATRRGEALAALQVLGLGGRSVYFARLRDQHLAWDLQAGWRALESVVRQVRPGIILTPSFEGGHPDHDATNLLAAYAQTQFGTAVWEYPLYSVRDGAPLHRQFHHPEPTQVHMAFSAAQRARKAAAWRCYRSQAATLEALQALEVESFRPLPPHDYTRPALNEPAVYERWGWPMTATAVAVELKAFRPGPRLAW